jgi:hypothetical protein
MAFDSARIVEADASLFETSLRVGFDRPERFALLVGGIGLGTLGGLSLALGLGALSLSTIVMIAAPLLVLALYLTSRTLTEAITNRAYGCATATALHGAALLAWPMAALLAPVSAMTFWAAPMLGVSALIMFASCWQGAPRAVYRLSAQGLLVGVLTAHHGTMMFMGA